MAQLDASIFLNQKGPDFEQIGEGFDRGIRLGELMRERKIKDLELQKQNNIKQAYNSAYDVAPDGSRSLNIGKLTGNLSSIGEGQEAYKAANDFKAQQAANMEMQSKIRTHVLDNKYGDLENIVKNPNDPNNPEKWKSIYDFAKTSGMEMAGYSPTYDPQVVKSIYASAIPLVKQRELQISEEKNKIDWAKIQAEKDKKADADSVGEKESDKKYAPVYNDFVNGGQQKALDAIAKLKAFKKKLDEDDGFIQSGGGPISGSLSDAFRSTNSIAIRDNIVTAANSGLKGTFGGQLSDGERKAAANEYYNDKLPNSENSKILDQKITELENSLAVQKAMASHYGPRKTLKGFQPIVMPSKQDPPPPNLDFNKLPDDQLFMLYQQHGGN